MRKPEPMISTPSSRSGRSRLAERRSAGAGSWVGSDIWSTGMSASGYMIRSGTHAPWSSPRRGVLVHRLGVGHQRGDPRRPARRRRGSRRSSGSTSARSRRSRRPAPTPLARTGEIGADSQWALTIRIAVGRGRSPAQRGELARPDRVVEQRRGAVADVERGHAVGHADHNSFAFNFIPASTLVARVRDRGRRPVDRRGRPARLEQPVDPRERPRAEEAAVRRQRATGGPTPPRGSGPAAA